MYVHDDESPDLEGARYIVAALWPFWRLERSADNDPLAGAETRISRCSERCPRFYSGLQCGRKSVAVHRCAAHWAAWLIAWQRARIWGHIGGGLRTVCVLSGGVLSTVVMPDTEEVTGSIPASPTGSKMAPDLRKREPGIVLY